MQFRKYSHHFSPNIRLWLRKNVFYYIVELPRVDGKRRYKRISLHTNNYYEARERIKQMSITFEPEIANQMRMKLALNPFPTQERANQMRNEAIRTYNTEYAALHPEAQLASPNNNSTTMTQNQIQSIVSSMLPAPKEAPTHTIRKVFDAMLLKGGNSKRVQIRKTNAFELMLQSVGLSWDDDYAKFHNVALIEELSRNILALPDIQNEGKLVRFGYIREIAKCAYNMEPDFYKLNVISNLPNISKTKKSLLKPHLPYSQDQLLTIFDPKYDFFKKNPDAFWLCMIALFTGSRANAAMTLQYDDMIKENGIDCIYFRSNHPIKNLKNGASERKVPIHKQLLDLGFVDYVKRKQKKLSAKGTDFIISHAVTKTGQYNNKYMDRVLFPFFESIGVKQSAHDSHDFHSFRKNASLAMQAARIPDAFINDIIGWEGVNMIQQHYSNHGLQEIQVQLDTFEYDFLAPHFAIWKSVMSKKP